MKCTSCGTINEEDAIFCKKCGISLLSDYKKSYKDNNKKKNKVKTKTKIKTKTKVKKVKPKREKQKEKVVVREKTGLGTKVLIFLLILLIIVLLSVIAVFGYREYQQYNIEVPNVIDMTYSDAQLTLAKKGLNIEKKEETVEDENEVGIVIKQNKKVGSKVKKNATIKVTVGIANNKYELDNFIGMNIDDVVKVLEKNDIKYKIIYEEVKNKEDDIVLKQTPTKGKKVTSDDIVNLTVSKKIKIEDNDINEEENNDNEETSTEE